MITQTRDVVLPPEPAENYSRRCGRCKCVIKPLLIPSTVYACAYCWVAHEVDDCLIRWWIDAYDHYSRTTSSIDRWDYMRTICRNLASMAKNNRARAVITNCLFRSRRDKHDWRFREFREEVMKTLDKAIYTEQERQRLFGGR